jgi:hypothetical protein
VSIEGMVNGFLDFIALWWGFQWAYALTVLFLGSVIVDYYDWGTWENPQNAFQKAINFLMAFLVGAGPYLYKKFRKYNWFIRRLALLGVLIVGGLGAILAHLVLGAALKFLFL